MPSAEEVQQADAGMDVERRLASLESTLSTLLANGLKDMLTAHGDQEFGGGVARLDSHGMQIVKVGAGLNYDPSIFFQDKFSSAPSSDGRLALIRGLKAGNTDGTTLFISMGVRDADGDSAVVNVDNSIDGRPTVMLQSTENGVRTTYLGLSAFFDEISVGGVLNLDDKGANPSTFAALPDGGYIWFDGTNDKFRGRLNSANYNFLLEGDASRFLNRQAADNDINTTAAETTLYTYTIPAATLGTTGSLRLRLQGDYLNNTGAAATYTLRVKLGATTLFDDVSGGLASSATRRPWFLDLVLANQSATSQVLTFGHKLGSSVGGATGLGDMTAAGGNDTAHGGASSENTANALTLAVTIQHSASSANLSMRRRYALLELT